MRSALVVSAALAALAVVAPPSATAQTKLVNIVGTRVYEPVVDEASSRDPRLLLRVPVVARRGVNPRRLEAELLAVEIPNRPEKAIFNAFTVQMLPPTNTPRRGPAIQLEMRTRPAVPAGTYKVRVGIRRRAGGRAQRVAFSIRLANATVPAPGVVRIRRISHIWPFDSTTETAKVTLQETSRSSQVTGITIQQVDPLKNGTETATGSIQAQTKPDALRLDPGGTTQVTVEPTGDFPLGTSTGQVTINGGELASPVTATIEVVSRKGRDFLVLTLVFGVLLGYLTRVFFFKRIEWGQAVAQANAVLARMTNARIHYGYGTLHRDLDRESTAIRSAINTRDPAGLNAAVTAAKLALDAALARVAAHSKDLETKINAPYTLLSPGYELPPASRAAVAVAQQRLWTARSNVKAGQLDAAEEGLDAAVRDLNALVLSEGRQWRDAVQSLVQALATDPPTLRGGEDAGVREQAKKIDKALDQIPFDADPATASTVINPMSATFVDVRTLLMVLTEKLSQLANAGSAQPPTVAKCRSALNAIGAAGNQSPGAIVGVKNALVALTAVSPPPTAPAPDTPLGGADTDAVVALASAPTGRVQHATLGLTASGVRVHADPPIEVMQARNARSLFKDELILALLIGIVVVLIGYWTFADDWVGTTGDFLKVFGFAYLADLTAAWAKERLPGGTAAPGASPPAPQTPAAPDPPVTAGETPPPAGAASSNGVPTPAAVP